MGCNCNPLQKKILIYKKDGKLIMLKSKITTIKLELEDSKEIYIMYEKTKANKYICSVYAGNKFYGNLVHQFGLEVPQEVEIGIRTNSDDNFEEDMIELVLNNVANDNIIWEENSFED